MPQISIIIPVYKSEDKLARCVNTVLAQSFTDFQLILVDDGSPDNSGKICDDFAKKDDRVIVFHNKNAGAAAARNAGIKAAKGKYIGFVDSDDFVAENHFEGMFSTAEKYLSDITMCDFLSVGKNSSETVMHHGFSEGTVLNRSEIKSKIYDNIFYNKNTVGYFSLWNKLFRRSLVTRNGILINEDMSFGEDMLFVMDCLKQTNSIAFCENAGYYYEMTEDGLFSKYRRGFIDDIAKCYVSRVYQTAPEGYTKSDLIPLSYKYWNYINRHLEGIARNEEHVFLDMRRTLKNKAVKIILSVMANLSKEKADEIGIAQSELKPARLAAKGLIWTAAFIADYQFNENFWLRRIRK